jgi:hypothetical protein
MRRPPALAGVPEFVAVRSIHPGRDGDRRGFVIAVAGTSVEALERAEAATTLLDVDGVAGAPGRHATISARTP